VNGFIEIYVDGWCRYRWLFTLRDYEDFSFEQQVELREADLKKIISHLTDNVIPNFDPARTQYFITYQSKLNEQPVDEETGDLHQEQLQNHEPLCDIGCSRSDGKPGRLLLP
jgi:hypothetical protein